MGGAIIVGAMIGAGVGGVVSGQKTGSPWAGAALGALGGAAGGAALGASGIIPASWSSTGAAAAGAGVDAATAGAVGMAPATAAEAALGSAGAAAGVGAAGLGSSVLQYGAPMLSMASSVGSLLTSPDVPDIPSATEPETFAHTIVPQSTSESAVRTPWEIDQATKARLAREQAYAKEQALAQQSEAAALKQLRDSLTLDERYFGPPSGAQAALTGTGGLGHGRPLT